MSFVSDNTPYSIPVTPMYGNCGMNDGFGFGGGGMGAWWLLVLLFAMGGWNNNNGNNNDSVIPYLMASNSNNTNSDVQRGFDQQALVSGIGNITNSVNTGFSGVQQSLCNGFAGVNATVSNGLAATEANATNRQMANMQQIFGLQQQLAQCCCDNRLATAQTQALVQSENCADRNALQQGITDVLIGGNNNTQRLVDTVNAGFDRLDSKLCQLELDGYKRDLDAANAKIISLENAASRANDRAIILADNAAQTAALEQYLNPPPRPAYVVPNPNGCNCNGNGYGYCN